MASHYTSYEMQSLCLSFKVLGNQWLSFSIISPLPTRFRLKCLPHVPQTTKQTSASHKLFFLQNSPSPLPGWWQPSDFKKVTLFFLPSVVPIYFSSKAHIMCFNYLSIGFFFFGSIPSMYYKLHDAKSWDLAPTCLEGQLAFSKCSIWKCLDE